jgi:predicted transcriptional regulator
MAPPSQKRKSAAAPEPQTAAKRLREVASIETLEKELLRSPTQEVEELDMVEIDDDQKLEEFRAQQQADLIKRQNQEKADMPVKLSNFQCIICLDNPTDLTVTHCGM